MSTLRIYGASDDLAEFEGHCDGEVGCYDSRVTVEIGKGDEATGVFLEHSGSVGWQLGTFMPDGVDEDHWTPLAVTLTSEKYSPLATIEVPDGVAVLCYVDGKAHEIA